MVSLNRVIECFFPCLTTLQGTSLFLVQVHIGGIAEFKCVVSGSGYSGHLIGWYKDGRPILSGSSGRVTGDSLVVSSVGREDRGMYQCLVRRAEGETAQASAELQLGGKFSNMFSYMSSALSLKTCSQLHWGTCVHV